MRSQKLELYQLNIKQLSPKILNFRTKHKDNQDNLFTLNCFVVSRSFLFIFHAGWRGLSSNNFRNSSYKEKTARSARVSRLSFRFLWLCFYTFIQRKIKREHTRCTHLPLCTFTLDSDNTWSFYLTKVFLKNINATIA